MKKLDKKAGFLDLFDWLKVKTQFKYLKKILKYVLVNGVNDSEN
jgi:hypothetical protein